jgi:hypothetical protein
MIVGLANKGTNRSLGQQAARARRGPIGIAGNIAKLPEAAAARTAARSFSPSSSANTTSKSFGPLRVDITKDPLTYFDTKAARYHPPAPGRKQRIRVVSVESKYGHTTAGPKRFGSRRTSRKDAGAASAAIAPGRHRRHQPFIGRHGTRLCKR